MYLQTAIVLTMFAVAGNAAELSIGHGVVAAETPAAIGVSMAGGGATPTGVQFDLEYDAASLNVTVEAGPAAAQAGKGVQSAALPSGKLRVLIVGINRNVMADGVVAILHVSLKAPAAAGKTFPLGISASAATNAQAAAVPLTGRDGSVRVEVRGNVKGAGQ
jgi:hypothetical protein